MSKASIQEAFASMPRSTTSKVVDLKPREKKLTSTPSIFDLQSIIAERDEEIIQLKQEIEDLRYGGDVVDRELRERYGQLMAELQPQERRMLKFLYFHRGKVMSKERILCATYPNGIREDHEYPLKTVDVYICRIRKAINRNKLKNELFIATEWGQGYTIMPLTPNEQLAFQILAASGALKQTRTGIFTKVVALLESDYISSDLDQNQRERWPYIVRSIEEIIGKTVIIEHGRMWLSQNRSEPVKNI